MSNFTGDPIEILGDKGLQVEDVADSWTRYLDVLQPVMQRANELGIGKAKQSSQKDSKKEDESNA